VDGSSGGISMCQVGGVENQLLEGAIHMNVTTIGVDLAKSFFQLHGVDKNGAVVFRRKRRRSQVLTFLRNWRHV
jgi:hypothetical protein